MNELTVNDPPTLLVTFRGTKMEEPLVPGTTVAVVKEALVRHAADPSLRLLPNDVRLMFKGKLLKDDQEDLYETLFVSSSVEKKPKSVYRLLATGVSQRESVQAESDLQEGLRAGPRLRDDITDQGKRELQRRQRVARLIMIKAEGARSATDEYGFGRVEALPNLPSQGEAQRLLESLANDPGVRACMTKHNWKVGSLAELYPEGKVGESEVCVMGLNKNKGQQILLRIRTDNLQGFRKMLSIRKVLFHELAHNVHSEHDGNFFQLMRQIEQECNAMDWTEGAGLSTEPSADFPVFEGGTFRLGGDSGDPIAMASRSRRELAAQAALRRITVEEEEIANNCGCNRHDLFLPPKRDDALEE
jgi:hypothetical protein